MGLIVQKHLKLLNIYIYKYIKQNCQAVHLTKNTFLHNLEDIIAGHPKILNEFILIKQV